MKTMSICYIPLWHKRMRATVGRLFARGDTRELLDSGVSDDPTVAFQKLVQLMTFTKKKLGRRAECIVATPS